MFFIDYASEEDKICNFGEKKWRRFVCVLDCIVENVP